MALIHSVFLRKAIKFQLCLNKWTNEWQRCLLAFFSENVHQYTRKNGNSSDAFPCFSSAKGEGGKWNANNEMKRRSFCWEWVNLYKIRLSTPEKVGWCEKVKKEISSRNFPFYTAENSLAKRNCLCQFEYRFLFLFITLWGRRRAAKAVKLKT